MSATSYVMKVSRNGQVSIPAEARARWDADKVLVVDLGDRIVMRPTSDTPVAELRGKYVGLGPDTESMRNQERDADALDETR